MSKVSSFALITCLLSAPAFAADAPLSDTDTYALQSAEAACAERDFPALLNALAISRTALLKYAAPEIAVRIGADSARVKREDYQAFPIAMVDYYWVSASSAKAFDADPNTELEHLKLEFNQSQSDVWRVDWVRVRYDGKTEGGDDLGNVIGTIGDPGYLLFRPTATCWELTDDITGETAKAE